MDSIYTFFTDHLGWITSHLTLILLLLAGWSLVWKGIGLWFAARNYQKYWFIAILILNTLGVLEIIYLIWFRRDKQEGVTKSLFNNPLPGPEEEEVA
jgi:methionyl-tRNA synthetase